MKKINSIAKVGLTTQNDKLKLNILFALFIFLCIFITDSTLMLRSLNEGLKSFRKVFFIVGSFIGFLRLFIVGNERINLKEIAWLISIVFITILSAIMNDENINGVIAYISKYIFAFVLCFSFTYEKFKYYFLTIMRLIAAVSVVVYLLYQVVPEFGYLLPRLITESSNSVTMLEWGTLLLTNVPLNNTISWTARNFGPFWEPGVFAIYLNIALYMVLFQDSRSKKQAKDIIIFTSALITTLSSGGIIACCILIIAYFFYTKQKNMKIKIVVLLLIVFATYYLLEVNTYFTMLLADRFSFSSYNGSLDSRIYSILGNIYVWIRNPFLGAGITNVDYELFHYYKVIAQGVGFTLHNTNTLLVYFASSGIIVGTYQAIAWFKFTIQRNKKISILLILFIIVLLSNEDMTQSIVFILLPLYGLFDRKGETNNENTMGEQLPITRYK